MNNKSHLNLLNKAWSKLLTSQFNSCGLAIRTFLLATQMLCAEYLSHIGHIQKLANIQLSKGNTDGDVHSCCFRLFLPSSSTTTTKPKMLKHREWICLGLVVSLFLLFDCFFTTHIICLSLIGITQDIISICDFRKLL